MSELVERVAKTLFEDEYMGRSWDNDYDCYAKDSWRKIAAKVITVVREFDHETQTNSNRSSK